MSSINVPDGLPEILKNYVKAAIRTQPEDILSWSAEYFKTTDGLSTPDKKQKNGLIFNRERTLFRILAFQLGTTVGTKERIKEVWSDLSLNCDILLHIYTIGKFYSENVDMVEFLGITFGHWTKSLKETMLLCCEAFCKCLATDGYFLHVDVACKLYEFLAKLDCSLPARDGDDDGTRLRTRVDDDDRNNNETRKTTVKTSHSLDVQSSPTRALSSSSENGLVTCVSLESVLVQPVANASDGGKTDGIMVDGVHSDNAGYDVPGIGPPISNLQVQRVLEYFRKCATENGGYVYDFNIENDNCPQLDAVDN